jgi:hypothetical protein
MKPHVLELADTGETLAVDSPLNACIAPGSLTGVAVSNLTSEDSRSSGSDRALRRATVFSPA